MAADGPKKKILVMDDEPHIRSITRKMLEKFGYAVTLASDGREAVSAYRDALDQGSPYRLVILDLAVPCGMGGKDAAREILAIDPSACLAVASGYTDDPLLEDYTSYGLKGVIPKPFRLAELKETVRRLTSPADPR